MTISILILCAVMTAALLSCSGGEPQPAPAKLKELDETSPATTSSLLQELIVNEEKLPDTTRAAMVNVVLANAKDSGEYRFVSALLLKAFADPNSLYRNEELSILVWKLNLQSAFFNAKEKKTISTKLNLAFCNRVGTTATGFIYTDASGMVHTLHEISARYVLLYFYNPECEACKMMTHEISTSPFLNEKIATGRLVVLAMYTDPDIALWRRHLPELPVTWRHGYDSKQVLWSQRLYDLRSIPTLYLLDSTKKVLVKDGTLPDIVTGLKKDE